MAKLRVQLFGRLALYSDDALLPGFESRKAQELFCYLVLNHDKSHPRDVLATLLWDDCATAQSRKLLRHTLWQVHSRLEQAGPTGAALLHVEPAWVSLNISADVWIDALEFYGVAVALQGTSTGALPDELAQQMREAVALYHSDLLEGCYQDWCLYERERFLSSLLMMLDRLVVHCQATSAFDEGVAYGQRILRYDRTRERTHCHLMLLYYLSGDRTEALRQFQRCESALADDLGVEPSQPTLNLVRKIRDDYLGDMAPASMGLPQPSLPQILGDLRHLWTALGEMQQQVKTHIELVEQALGSHRHK